MSKNQDIALELIEKQQKGLGEYEPAFMVGEQLKDIVRVEPESADLLARDLDGKGMGIRDAEHLISEEARKHKKGNSACVPPWIAEDILRQFYGLRPRTWGPGKEAKDGSAGRLPAPQETKDRHENGKVVDLTEFF